MAEVSLYARRLMAAERTHGLERSRTIMIVREQLRQYLFETLIPAERDAWPADDSDLFDLGLDSLRLMQLLVFVEKEINCIGALACQIISHPFF